MSDGGGGGVTSPSSSPQLLTGTLEDNVNQIHRIVKEQLIARDRSAVAFANFLRAALRNRLGIREPDVRIVAGLEQHCSTPRTPVTLIVSLPPHASGGDHDVVVDSVGGLGASFGSPLSFPSASGGGGGGGGGGASPSSSSSSPSRCTLRVKRDSSFRAIDSLLSSMFSALPVTVKRKRGASTDAAATTTTTATRIGRSLFATTKDVEATVTGGILVNDGDDSMIEVAPRGIFRWVEGSPASPPNHVNDVVNTTLISPSFSKAIDVGRGDETTLSSEWCIRVPFVPTLDGETLLRQCSTARSVVECVAQDADQSGGWVLFFTREEDAVAALASGIHSGVCYNTSTAPAAIPLVSSPLSAKKRSSDDDDNDNDDPQLFAYLAQSNVVSPQRSSRHRGAVQSQLVHRERIGMHPNHQNTLSPLTITALVKEEQEEGRDAVAEEEDPLPLFLRSIYHIAVVVKKDENDSGDNTDDANVLSYIAPSLAVTALVRRISEDIAAACRENATTHPCSDVEPWISGTLRLLTLWWEAETLTPTSPTYLMLRSLKASSSLEREDVPFKKDCCGGRSSLDAVENGSVVLLLALHAIRHLLLLATTDNTDAQANGGTVSGNTSALFEQSGFWLTACIAKFYGSPGDRSLFAPSRSTCDDDKVRKRACFQWPRGNEMSPSERRGPMVIDLRSFTTTHSSSGDVHAALILLVPSSDNDTLANSSGHPVGGCAAGSCDGSAALRLVLSSACVDLLSHGFSALHANLLSGLWSHQCEAWIRRLKRRASFPSSVVVGRSLPATEGVHPSPRQQQHQRRRELLLLQARTLCRTKSLPLSALALQLAMTPLQKQ